MCFCSRNETKIIKLAFLLRKQHSEGLNKIKKWFNEELSNKYELKKHQIYHPC